MKSQNRAWIMFTALFLSWNTLPGSPFQYFADMIRQWFGLIVIRPFLPAAWQSILIYFMVALLLSGLLLAGRSGNRFYLAGFCSLATLVHHLVYCISTGRLYPVSPAIAIGLALALLFLIIKAKSPALWLTDAYVLSLAVWLIRDGVLPPVLSRLELEQSSLAGFLALSSDPLIANLDRTWHLPMIVWSIVPLALAIVPLILFARGRQKG
ncbi:MAG: hypothetical protein SCM11_01660 [Bacillota bacterium]|nr:hypothetical protein [Bacillota bacterium]